MDISVVISVFNGETTIRKALESILKQIKSPKEIIVYDDASTDCTVSIVEQISACSEIDIQLIRSDVNRGPGGGKNYALSFVKSDYFLFLDADDYLDADYISKIEKGVRFLNLPQKPDVIITGLKHVAPDGKVIASRKYRSAKHALWQAVSNWGKLWSKDFIQTNHIEIPSGMVLEDVMTRSVIVCKSPRVICLNSVNGYNYVINKDSVSNKCFKKFVKGAAVMEIRWLKQFEASISDDHMNTYHYWVYKTFCWHLLKSGAGVGVNKMMKEYCMAKTELNRLFPDINGTCDVRRRHAYERRVVDVVVRVMGGLDKVGLQKAFLCFYSMVDLSFLWPRM